jgi:hypothetical protein
MANTFDGLRWIIDTPGSDNITTDYACVKHVEWNGDSVIGAGGAPQAVIQSPTGKVLWEAYATGATFHIHDLIENHWFDGFKVPTLSGGRLEIVYK